MFHAGNAELLFEEATRLHKDVLYKYKHLQESSYNKAEVERVCKFYLECQQMVSEALTSKLQSYDLPTIFIATSAVIMVSYVFDEQRTFMEKHSCVYQVFISITRMFDKNEVFDIRKLFCSS